MIFWLLAKTFDSLHKMADYLLEHLRHASLQIALEKIQTEKPYTYLVFIIETKTLRRFK